MSDSSCLGVGGNGIDRGSYSPRVAGAKYSISDTDNLATQPGLVSRTQENRPLARNLGAEIPQYPDCVVYRDSHTVGVEIRRCAWSSTVLINAKQ